MDGSPDLVGPSKDRPGRIDLSHPLVAEVLARCNFGEPAEVVCAVSGGADSTALAVLAVAHGHRVTAVHVDHGLRPGSADEAEVVAGLAARLGAGFRAETVTVAPGPNLEARAREARRSVLPPDALTGHTADDRAETVLLNLLRGAGPAGLQGMVRSDRRPLLDVRRSDTEALCDALGLVVIDDPSNRDPSFRRNRVRHEVLPLLADVFDRDPVPLIGRQADRSAVVADLLDDLASDIDPTDARALAAAPAAVAATAVRRWLREEGIGDGYGIDAEAVDRVLAVARGEAVACQVVGGHRVARTAGRLRLEPAR